MKVVKKKLEGGIIHTKAYLNDSSLWYESYMLNDESHREDGPAFIVYRRDGSVNYKEYRLNGKLHREEEYKVWLLNKEADECIHEMLVGGING